MLQSKLIDEYQQLKAVLINDEVIVELIAKRNYLITMLDSVDKYSSDYAKYQAELNVIANKLISNQDYVRFKALERELNLFVMDCNNKLKKLFALNEKGRCT